MTEEKTVVTTDFIRNIIAEDLKSNKHGGKVVTRFPPEPNGYLHIGHAKSICLNFGVAEENEGGICHLRFDDTNPEKEDEEYIEAIKRDIQWLGFDWQQKEYHASHYFEQLYQYAIVLIKKGKAYVCDLSAEEMREYRGTLKAPGKNSPYRDRSVEENLDLFQRMRAAEFEDGSHLLRAKIDMTSPNMNMRDPALYRIKRMTHHQTGDKWCIYPMYDYTHCLSDSIEGITHSLCTLEFEDHRPLYDWVLDQLEVECHPQQIEFSRLNLEYTVTSKRKLGELVTSGSVSGWDDPRMPTVSGLRRRGYTAKAVRNLCKRVGISKNDSTTDMALLEDCIREDLDSIAPRVMGVLKPLKVVIENYPAGQVEELQAKFHPKDESMGSRVLPFSRELYIDESDFEEVPPPKYRRLTPGKEVRLRYGYVIKCEKVIKDPETDEILELRCTYDANTLGKKPEGRKVKGVIHWVSAEHSIEAEVRLYDRLFSKASPDSGKDGSDFKEHLNPDSFLKLTGCRLEPGLLGAKPGIQYQFEREGYFCQDHVDSKADKMVFNRIVTLRDSWAKMVNQK
ncbi:MAG: glutamine--tRNA ligase [SAR324 cluster bacterium]|uniref:Glutamine--tRNA ligase n=1 Tax=SAR324 cluster bacterium TaxID=2024889 RepID=A0A2A4T8F1_9DELT|nr:MAG: glutamine--tRNA ligase [SAR324 cluster bacterium]